MKYFSASIISKKAAEGISSLVMDVKFGKGSYQKTVEDARDVANLLVSVGKGVGLHVTAFITRMTDPIGRGIGNALEVAESIEFLRGNRAPDLEELVVVQSAELLVLSGKFPDRDSAKAGILSVLDTGVALAKFEQMLVAQGVDSDQARVLCRGDMWEVLQPAKNQTPVPYQGPVEGVITEINSLTLGNVANDLSRSANNELNHAPGLRLSKASGQRVCPGEILLTVHHDSDRISEEIIAEINGAFIVDPQAAGEGYRERVVERVE